MTPRIAGMWRIGGRSSFARLRHLPNLPGRRRRPSAVHSGLVVAGLVATAVVVACLAAWRIRRRDESALDAGPTLDAGTFDSRALDRAEDEGMVPAPLPRPSEAPAATNRRTSVALTRGGLVRLA